MAHTTVARVRTVAAAGALTLVLSLFVAGVAQAQFLPAVFYGTGLEAGQTVEAFIDGRSCGSTTTNAAGEWKLQIAPDAPCAPAPETPLTDGAGVTFTIDGEAATAEPAATWESGGIPAGSIRTGYALTADGEGGGGETGGGSETAAEDDGGGSNAALLIGGGVVVLLAAAAGGFFILRRNA